MFTVRINGGNDRINTGAVEKAIRATFAEVLSEDVHVFVEQPDDHTLCITVDREGDEHHCFEEGAEATAQADRLDETEAELIARVEAEEAHATGGSMGYEID